MSRLSSSISNEQMLRMHELLDEVLEIQKSTKNIDQGMIRTQEIINESSKLVENSNCPSEVLVDAKILNVGSNFCSANVSGLNTNLTHFSEEKYVEEMLKFVEESRPERDGTEWEALAPYTYHLFRKSQPLTFMLGPVCLTPLSSQEDLIDSGKKKIERHKRKVDEEKKVIDSVEDFANGEDAANDDVYEHLLKSLVRQYKKNNKKSVNYFRFVLDPEDYWKTIENIFHFAFLVRDGNVKMSLENGVPHVEPTLKKPGERSGQSQNSQFCLSLSVEEWRRAVEVFQVTSSCIAPFVRKEKNH